MQSPFNVRRCSEGKIKWIFKFSVFPYNVARILLYYPHNELSTLCAYLLLPALGYSEQDWNSVICGGFLGDFQAQHYPPKWQWLWLSQKPYCCQRAIWLVAGYLGSTQQPESCQYNCFSVFFTQSWHLLFFCWTQTSLFFIIFNQAHSVRRGIYLESKVEIQKYFS